MPNKKKRKSKSMGNKRFRRKRTIKLNRKFNRKNSRRRRRRRRKQRGGGEGGWFSGITNLFATKKKDPEFIGVQDIPPNNPAAVKRNEFFNQMGKQYNNLKDAAGGLAQKTKDVATTVTNNVMNNPELKGMIDRNAMSDFNKLEADFTKLKNQFEVIGNWINKRTKDPTKCPCCKQLIQQPVKGKGLNEGLQLTTSPPDTQEPAQKSLPAMNEQMKQMKQMEQMEQMKKQMEQMKKQ